MSLPPLIVWLAGCGWLTERAEVALDLDLDLDRTQIEQMCRAAQRLDADTKADAARKLDQLAAELARDHLGQAGVALLEAVKRSPPAARRKLVQGVLRHNGLDGLDCPPLERILFQR